MNERGRVISHSSAGNPWRYRGKRVDKEISLMYFIYRYYEHEVGRRISPDLAGAIDGPNLYAYARNNPMKYVDYFGLSSALDENCGCTQHGHPGWHNAPEGCVCICGKNGSAYASGSYRSKIGSDIKSAIMFLCILFGVIADWLIWHKILDVITLTGMICVIVGGVVTIYFGQKELMRK